MTQWQMVVELNQLGIKSPRGGAWGLCQVQRVTRRLESRAG